MKGYKGFDNNLKCRGYQFEIGKEYSIDGKLEICENGFHYCPNPLDVFEYYPPEIGTRYCEVEAVGVVVEDGNKCATSKIKIVREVSSKHMYKEGFALLNVVGQTLGDYAHSQTLGNYAHSQTSGYKAHSQTLGDGAHSQTSGYKAHSQTLGDGAHSQTLGNYAHSQTLGDEAISCSLGIKSKSRAEKGWIVIVDWIYNDKWTINGIHSAKVGGEIMGVTIEPDKSYWFEDGVLKSE